jgi:hypothetical protein
MNDRGPEYVERRYWTGIKTSKRDQIMPEDAFAGIENQHDQCFLRLIEPVSFRDVVLPIFDCSVWGINQFQSQAFTDADNFEFVGQILFHRN